MNPWEQYQAGNVTAVADAPSSKPGPWDAYKSAKAGPWMNYKKASPVAPPIKLNPLYNQGVHQPSEFSSGMGADVPISENPDWAFTKATRGGLPGILSDAANAIQSKVVEPAAAKLMNVVPFHPKVEAGKPLIPDTWLPLADEKGFIPALSRTLKGFSTPGNIVTLPFALGSKAVQKVFLWAIAASAPDSIDELAKAETPNEIKDAATSLGINALFAGMLAKGIKDGSLTPQKPVGEPDATTLSSHPHPTKARPASSRCSGEAISDRWRCDWQSVGQTQAAR